MSHIQKKWTKKLIAWVMLVQLIAQPTLAAAAAVADPNAAAQNKPKVESAPNGVPVVQIATPSTAGVSHNLFTQFDIDSKGLILNNSYTIAQTKLGGYIAGNANLAGGSAKIILNEVTGSNISQLNGYAEVAGQKADVIIANPNGIVGSGFGFINTGRGVLTTGTPVFGGNGSLDAFRVMGGQIAVNGTGVDASSADRVDLISRAVQVNAGIWGKELNVVTGANQVNYSDLSTQKITGNGNTPTVAIDVGALGGMYANKIMLVGTETGVGVNSQGILSASNGNLTLTNDGNIMLAGSLSASGSVNVTANDDINASGSIYAQGNANVYSAGTLINSGVLAAGQNTAITAGNVSSSGTLGAGIQPDGSIGTTGDMTLTSGGNISARGKTIAAGSLNMNATAIDITGGKTFANGAATLIATAGDVNNSGGTLVSNGTLNVSATGTVKNDKDVSGIAGQIQANKLTLTAGDISNQGSKLTQLGTDDLSLHVTGNINNNGGTIAANSHSLDLAANSIANSQGLIQHAGTGTLTIATASDLNNNSGSIETNGQGNLSAQNIDNTQGNIASQKGLGVSAASVTNNQGSIIGSDAVSITVQGAVDNRQGVIQSSKGLTLAAQSLNNNSGQVINLDTSDAKVTVNQEIQNQSGHIGGNGKVSVSAGNIVNQSGQLTAGDSLNASATQGIDNTKGTITAAQDLTLSPGALTNNSGVISAGNNLSIQAASIDNTNGKVTANQDITLNAQSLSGNGQVVAGQDLTINLNGDLTNNAGGQLQANRNLSLATAGILLNQGNMIGVQNANITGSSITNDTGATLAAGSAMNLTAGSDVTNNGKLSGNAVTVKGENVTNTGTVVAGTLGVQADRISNGASAIMNTTGDMNLNANKVDSGSITNQGTIYAQGNTTVHSAGTLTNSGVLAAGQNTAITAQSVASSGTLGAGINTDGSIGTTGDLTLTSNGNVSANGKTLAAGSLDMNAAAIDIFGGKTSAVGAATLTATAGDVNNTGGTLVSNGTLNVSATGTIHNDKDVSGIAGQIQANKITLMAGDISNQGSKLTQLGTDDLSLHVTGNINNNGGMIASNSHSLDLAANSIANSQGLIQHAGTGTLILTTATNLDNAGGTVETNGQGNLSAQNIDNTQGTITSQKGLDVNAASVTNNQGSIIGSDAVGITVQGAVDNGQGIIQAGKGLIFAAKSLNNNSGQVINLDTSDAKLTVNQEIQNQSGRIGGNGKVSVSAGNIVNQSGQLIAGDDLMISAGQGVDNTQGTITAAQDLTINPGALTNNSGVISAGNNLNIQATAVDNTSGKVLANKDITFNAQSFSGNGQTIAGQDLTINLSGDLINTAGGQLQANRNLSLTTSGILNQGNMIGVQNATITGSSIINDTGATLAAGSALSLAAGSDMTNSGKLSGNAVTVNGQNVTNSGTVVAGTLGVQAETISNGASAIMNTSGDMNLNANKVNDGNLTNQGTIYAQGNANINTTGILTNSGVLAAGRNTTVAAQNIASNGVLGAGMNSDGSIGTAGDLILTVGGNISANGKTIAAGGLNMNATAIDISGGQTSAVGSTTLIATAGDVNNTGGTFVSNGTLNVSTTGTIRNDKDVNGIAGQMQANKITLKAGDISNKGGSIRQLGTDATNLTADNSLDNTGGVIGTNGSSLTLQSSTLTNSQGQIIHAGTGMMTVEASGDLANTGGAIVTNGQATIQAQNIDNTLGAIAAQKKLDINAASITNAQGSITSRDAVNIMMPGAMDNQQGVIQANKGLILTTHSLNNQSGKVINLDASDAKVTVDQAIQNQSGLIGGNGSANVTAQSLTNTKGQVVAQGNLTVTTVQDTDNTTGTIAAGQDIVLNHGNGNLINNSGKISAGGTINVQAAAVDNTSGNMVANTDINLTMQNLNNAGGTITTGQDINITSNNDFTNVTGSTLQANRAVHITAAGTVLNQGSITSVKDMKIIGSNITNDTGATMAAGNALNLTASGDVNNNGRLDGNAVTVSGQNVNNTATVTGGAIMVQANNISNSGSSAILASTGNINLNVSNSLTNQDSATIYSMGNTTIAGSANRNANGQPVDKAGSVLNQSSTIQADGDIAIYANDIVNKKKVFVTGQTVVSDENYITILPYSSCFTDDGTEGGAVAGVLFMWSDEYKKYAIAPLDGFGRDGTFMFGKTVTETNVIQDSPQGKILAGDNINLQAGNVTNDNSWILADGTLNSVGKVNNISTGVVRTTTRHLGESRLGGYIRNEDGDGGSFVWVEEKSYDDTTNEQLPGYTSLFGGGKAVVINAPSVNNITKNPTNVPGGNVATFPSAQSSSTSGAQTVLGTNSNTTSVTMGHGSAATVSSSSIAVGNTTTIGQAGKQSTVAMALNETGTLQNGVTMGQGSAATVSSSSTAAGTTTILGQAGQPSTLATATNGTGNGLNITLPTNGLYTIHTDSSSHYLVETDSRFTSYSSFISSDYMLQKLGIDPAKTLKQIGDGFYEQKLVQDQITKLTGTQLLSGYTSNNDEFKTLINNGVTYAKQYNLTVGVALTADQMAALTSPIVWMVEQVVDGQTVLVPVVYIPQASELKSTGALITANNVQINATNDVTNSGTITATNNTLVSAANVLNIGGTISSGAVTQINATKDIINQSGKITGAQVSLVAGQDITNETLTTSSDNGLIAKTVAGKIAEISATGSLTAQAGRNIAITGAQISAGQDIALNAGQNLEVGAIATKNQISVGTYLDASTNNITSSIKGGGNVSLVAQQDVNLSGVQVSAGNNLSLIAGGNINLSAVKDEKIHDETDVISGGWKRTRTDDENVIGTTLQGGGNVTVAAVDLGNNGAANINRGNITVAGSNITSQNGGVTIAADKNVTVKEVTEKHESLVQTHTESDGFLSSTTTDTLDYSLVNQVKGSTISGDTVTVHSGSDLTVQGSNVVGTSDVNLTATNNINITSAKETGKDEHYSYTKTTGIFGSGLGFTIGSKSEKSDLQEKTLAEIGSTVGSINGNVVITAGNKVDSAGTTFVAGKDLNIIGKDVTLDNTLNTYDSQYKYEFKQSGLTVSLGGGAVTSAINAAGDIRRSGQVQDDRLKALYDYKAVEDLKDIKKNMDIKPSISVSLGSTKITSEQTTHTETVNTSNVNAGGDVNITATAGDVNLKGTKINAANVTLDAKNNIHIDAAQNKEQTTSTTSSSSSSVGGNIGSGYFANSSKGSGHENENVITNQGSAINASGTVSLTSGKDASITGSQVNGDKVVANIGGNLNITSLQDIDNYNAKNQNSGIGISSGHTGGVTGSLGKGKTDSNYNSVTEQAGIFAGKDGFDINVGKNTDLKGAVIASTATPDKNIISTDTLTHSDIQNKADYSASSVGVNVNTNPDAKYNEQGITPNIGVPVSGKADSTTKSAIADGTIEIRSNPNADLSDLSRNTDQAVNALGKIFDKKTVQEKQELANLFGEIAYEQVHIMSLNAQDAAQKELDAAKKNGASQEVIDGLQSKVDAWSEGGANKIALHALVGGIMSDIGGSGFTSGAVGAGVNEVVQKELRDRFKDQPDMWQWASALVGVAASKAVGGDAQAGGSAAASGTKNNGQAENLLAPAALFSVVLANGGKATVDASKRLVDGVWYLCDKAGNQIATWSEESGEWVSTKFGNSESSAPTQTASETGSALSTYSPVDINFEPSLGNSYFPYVSSNVSNDYNSSNAQTVNYQQKFDEMVNDINTQIKADWNRSLEKMQTDAEKADAWKTYSRDLSYEASKDYLLKDKTPYVDPISTFTLNANKNGITGTTVDTTDKTIPPTDTSRREESVTKELPNNGDQSNNNQSTTIPNEPPIQPVVTSLPLTGKDKDENKIVDPANPVSTTGVVTASTGETSNTDWTRMTTKQATAAESELGYEPTNYIAKNGEKIFYNKKTKTYISQDIGSADGSGSHNGGVWKMAKSPDEINSKKTRMGTYDGKLNKIGD